MLKPEAALRKDKATKHKLEHRHFAFIAQVLAGLPTTQRRFAAHAFADALAATNPKFDRTRFLIACENGA